MSNIAICCEGLAKQYQIGERERYKALRDVITDTVAAPLRRLRIGVRSLKNGNENRKKSTIWALNNVSFEIKRGEVVGIIGRNGAGKSTLLKILSRITEPTKGHVDIWGRVGSLLEVGTGFHPELTGRDNIFLNGAILGMTRAEIVRKLDAIVAFAEVEKFIDTPVKHYSSGMYVRLAFAVAAQMETEILLVDEVLAVGDAQFQKKCFEKFREISTGGRTILFVTHNMAALRAVCQKGIVLDCGVTVAQGEVNAVADKYLARVHEEYQVWQSTETESFIVEEVRITSFDGPIIKTFDEATISVRFTPKTDILDFGLYIGLLTSENQRVAGLDLKDFTTIAPLRAGQRAEVGFTIEGLPLLPGRYQAEIHVKDVAHHKFEFVKRTFPFDIVETPVYGGRKLNHWFGCTALVAEPFVNLL